MIVASIAGCTNSGQVGSPVASNPVAPATSVTEPSGTDRPAGTVIVAKPASTTFPIEARDIRLVRLGQQDIALQFELFNGTQQPVEPYDLGMGLIERGLRRWSSRASSS